MTDPDLLYEKTVTRHNWIKVYKNRVEISEGTFAPTLTTVLFRSITAITLDGPSKYLKIVTASGEVHRPKFAAGKIAEAAQKAILSQLA